MIFRPSISVEEKTTHSAYEVCLSNIPIIVEDKLTWKQVMEMRGDIASIKKIHRFRSWVDSELEGKEKGEIIQSFEKALDDYKYALKKHGIMTVVGGLTTILSASSTVIEAISGDFSTQISAGLAISGGLITYTATQLSDFFEKKREPIALIYELEKKFVESKRSRRSPLTTSTICRWKSSSCRVPSYSRHCLPHALGCQARTVGDRRAGRFAVPAQLRRGQT